MRRGFVRAEKWLTLASEELFINKIFEYTIMIMYAPVRFD